MPVENIEEITKIKHNIEVISMDDFIEKKFIKLLMELNFVIMREHEHIR